MKRILLRSLLVAIAIFIAGFHEWTARADAAISCSSVQIGKPVRQPTTPQTISTYWQAYCVNAMWRAEITLQYESGGSWHPMDCENSHPCTIYRPSDGGFYPSSNVGGAQGGTVFFDPNYPDCFPDRIRSRLKLIGAGGTVLGPYASPVLGACP